MPVRIGMSRWNMYERVESIEHKHRDALREIRQCMDIHVPFATRKIEAEPTSM